MSWYSDGEPFDEHEGCKRCNFNKKPSASTCKNCKSGDRWNYEDWSNEDECCANCKWIDTDPYDHGLVCVNSDSPYCAELWARPDDCCDEWERKDNE